ncbi:MAG: NifB/NifX family molybdenum-iron cluster-binding protein [Candidatus Diapherotrites archaeon]
MKIVIPTEGRAGLKDKVSQHFGRCNTYTFIDEKGKILEIIKNTSEHMGGKGLPPELMKAHNANILLCKGLGPRALDLCFQFGIEVFVFDGQTVQDFFNAWKNNSAKKAGADDICEEHKQ